MKHIIWKAYWNYENEEKWLNEMSAKGMSLSDYSWCRYVFEDTQPSQYTYRIELLKNRPSHPDSRSYIYFLEENGIEHVTSYMRWIYVRKNTSEGPFDLYTDTDSIIQHYRRIYTLWNTMMYIELIVGFVNISIGIINLNIGEQLGNFSNGNLVIGTITTALGLLFMRLGVPLKRKIKKLEQEKTIRE